MQESGDDFKELVRSNTSLVDLVSETVSLKPMHGGRQYTGLCPFHPDHNPSFFVYPDRQSYRCWVCDEGGDCFRWIMEIEKVSFIEALESLARRANMEMPRRLSRKTAGQSGPGRAETLDIVEWAAALMHQTLRTSPTAANARKYLAHRQLAPETVRNFRLGYHPQNRYWFQEQARDRYTDEQLAAAGLIVKRDNGPGYRSLDLADRLIFPIADERGRIVAFGGRVLPGSNTEGRGKYWNSQESSIFQKRRMMYSFDRARDTIRRQQRVLIVEGYMDCIACHQAGIKNAVATLGTALTEEHVRFLRRFEAQVVLVYDSDDAGQRAAERSISNFLSWDLDLRILNVPSGKDPADYLQEHSAEEFLQLVETASEAWEYKFAAILKRTDLSSIAGRQQTLEQMLEFLAAAPGLKGTAREDMILREVCRKVEVDERTGRQRLSELRGQEDRRQQLRGNDAVQSDQSGRLGSSAFDKAERELLEILLASPETVETTCLHIGPEDFETPRYRRLLELCLGLWNEEGKHADIGTLLAASDSDSEIISLINDVLDSAEARGTLRLLRESAESDSEQSIPVHLERVLLVLLGRRDRKLGQLSSALRNEQKSQESGLDEETKNRLRDLQQFRREQMGNPSRLK